MTFTKEQLQEIIDTDHVQCGEASALARMALAGMEAEHGHNPVMAYADSYRGMAKQGVESIPVWSVITDLERNIAPHFIAPQPLTTSERAELENYRNAQQVVPEGHSSVIAEQLAHILSGIDVTDHQRAIIGCAVDRLNKNAETICQLSKAACALPDSLDYQGAKELFNYLMNEEETNATVNGWNACRAAMLQGKADGNSPVTPDGWVMVPVEPTEDMCNVSHIGVDVYTGLARDDEYYSIGGVCAAKVYRAMLAAAPQQE